jgi:hypothetical protein
MVRKLLAISMVAGVVAALGVGSSACDGGGEIPKIDCMKTPPKKWSELTILVKCTNCHKSTRSPIGTANDQPDGSRHGATENYDYDSYDSTRMNSDQAQSDVAGVGLHLMPPTDDPQWKVDGGGPPPEVTEADKQDFYAWVQCGTPN